MIFFAPVADICSLKRIPMIAKLAPLAAAYKENGSTEALAELYDYLDQHTLAFNTYYTSPDGTGLVTAAFNMTGTFEEFAKSTNFPTPDLLKVKYSGNTVYVLFSELLEAE